MTRDEEMKNLNLLDRRIIERNIKKGLITRKDYEKHLKALPDVAANIATPQERNEEAPDEEPTTTTES